ncbi:MAG: type II secretion system protein [Candidatus Vogelbacteria bacterium]|nr:type II secretion system protein [Candidatus Vogelbacteria bacterium]
MKNRNAGFTLIEIMVSISIFTVVMLITMGALLSLNDSSRKAQALRTVIDNLNFSVEDMNRKIRTGDSYECLKASDIVNLSTVTKTTTPNCPGAAGEAVLLRTQDQQDGKPVWIAYIFYKDLTTGKGGIYLRSGVSNSPTTVDLTPYMLAITSPEVDIKRAEFRVVGSGSVKTKPMIIVNITGVVDLAKESLSTDFSLQTAISQRGF